MSKHTPGPWEYAVCPNNRDEIVGPLPDRVIIASVWPTPANPETAAYDARLIAAAPDIYTAAKRALTTLKAQGHSIQKGNVLDALDKALAKAEGRVP